MKDPAILFYTGDFLTGTLTLTDQEVGQYIRLLCFMHQKGGYLSENDMTKLCKPQVFDCIMEKFKKTGDGLFYNERLLTEMDRRKEFSEKQRTNGSKRWKNGKQSGICQTDATLAKSGICQTDASVLFSEEKNLSLSDTSKKDINASKSGICQTNATLAKSGICQTDAKVLSLEEKNLSFNDSTSNGDSKSISYEKLHDCSINSISNKEINESNSEIGLAKSGICQTDANGGYGLAMPFILENENENEDGVIIINNNLENENENLKIKNTYSAPQSETDYDFSDLKEIISKSNVNRWSHHFRIFWEIYPKKEGMEATQELFFTIMESGQVSPHKFFGSVKDYNTFCQVEYGDDYPRGKFIKQPLNWLRDKCWTTDWREKTKDATTKKKNPNMATHLFGN